MFKDVAKIVAETMNNYLMFEKLVKCQVVPSEKFHKNVFKGKINPLKPPSKMRRLAAKKELHATKTEKQNDKRNERQSKKLQKIQSKLEEFGVQLSVPKVSFIVTNGPLKNILIFLKIYFLYNRKKNR